MRRFLVFLLSFAALAIPTSSWEASTSGNLAITVTAGQAITGISLSNSTFTGGAASGTIVGAISVTMSPSSPAFSGSLSLSGTNASSFQISGSNLVTNGTVPAGNYNINIVATETGVTGSPLAQAETIVGSSGSSSDKPFTALHTYFMAATGCSDSNSGTSPGSPWCTPNHNVVCGDVIIAAPGAYTSSGIRINQQPSNCPSTSGGIDGTGGIYFAVLLCGGSSVGDCHINNSSLAAPDAAISINNISNWAIEGWQVGDASCCASPHDGRGFVAFADSSGTIITHHVAWINNIAAGTGQAFQIEEAALNHNVPGNGVDYVAVVGNIAQNSANWGQCIAAIDIVAPAQFDSGAGTHIYLAGNFAANNRSRCTSDGEAFMFDTWDAHGFAAQGVVENNMAWLSERYGWQGFYQWSNPGSSTWIIRNNTFFGNNQGAYSEFWAGEINLAMGGNFSSTAPYTVTIQNNIARTNETQQGGTGGPVYAMTLGGNWGLTIGGSGTENIYKGLRTSCTAAACDPGFNVAENDGESLGTNIYSDPGFANTTDLVNNRSGAPNCTGFTNVTACMGWNANTSRLTTPSVISDLTSTFTASAKGYQYPSTTCAVNAYYPVWLKGIVYLHWDGVNITEKGDLVTKPCGL
jgi:hypothetical protein